MNEDTIRRVKDAVDQERADKPFLVRIFLDLRDVFLDLPNFIKDKYFEYQKGYTRNDVYGLNDYLIGLIYEPLKDFVEHYETHGMALPPEFATDPGAWLMILKKIEYAFDAEYERLLGFNDMTFALNNAELREHDEKVQEGFELFGKYLRNMWD